MNFDLIIRGGIIVDGSGEPGYQADLGIVGDRIHAIGDLSAATASDYLDASQMVVAPGFVDVHNHAHGEMAGGILEIPDADNLVRQGITTLIAGNCGGSPWPIGDHLAQVEQVPIRQNYGLLVGMGTLHRQVGADLEPASPGQVEQMKKMAAQAISEGAFGISTGYFPDFVTTAEIAAVARPVAAAGGLYATHLRSEAKNLVASMAEAIAICEQSGCPAQISHIKCWGKEAWNQHDKALEMLEKGIDRGLDLSADCYPYTASFTGINKAVPMELRIEASRRGGLIHLLDRDLIETVRLQVEAFIEEIDGPENLVFAPLEPIPEIDGKTLAQVAHEQGEAAWRTVVAMMIKGNVSSIFFAMRESQVRQFLRHDLVFAASDGHLRRFGKGVSHPRNYGTFPRWIGHYGRDCKLFSLEQAVRKCTLMPARKFGLHERGNLAARKVADIVVFDPDSIIDTATFSNPYQYPVGICHVLVAGRLVVRDCELTSEACGRVLRF